MKRIMRFSIVCFAAVVMATAAAAFASETDAKDAEPAQGTEPTHKD